MNHWQNLYLCYMATRCINVQGVRACPANGIFVSVAISAKSWTRQRRRGLKRILFFVHSAPHEFVEFAIMQKAYPRSLCPASTRALQGELQLARLLARARAYRATTSPVSSRAWE